MIDFHGEKLQGTVHKFSIWQVLVRVLVGRHIDQSFLCMTEQMQELMAASYLPFPTTPKT